MDVDEVLGLTSAMSTDRLVVRSQISGRHAQNRAARHAKNRPELALITALINGKRCFPLLRAADSWLLRFRRAR